MQKDFLRRLNFFIYLLIIVVAITLQSTIFKYFPLNYLQPDFLTIIAVYFGFKRDNIEGATFVMLASLMMESHSSTGQYFYLTTYTYSFVIAKLISKIIVVPNKITLIFLSIALHVFNKFSLLLLLGSVGKAWNGFWHFFIYLIPGIITQAFSSMVCLQWFNNIDLKTYKDEHSEDEYDINREF